MNWLTAMASLVRCGIKDPGMAANPSNSSSTRAVRMEASRRQIQRAHPSGPSPRGEATSRSMGSTWVVKVTAGSVVSAAITTPP
ncbi:MAG: hypothetical protein V9E98_11170 [Candidatus Nanopelagicales bacterium]